MKRTVILALVSLVLMFAFTALTVGGILSVSVQNPGGENLTLEIPESMGTEAVDTPLTKRQLQKKYEKFNTVTQENGKTAVTIFSEEQINDFNKRREQGEWFWLSTEEMLFLIEDTIRLFETYDLVYIRGLDGVLHKYYGLSFFSSEEYYASFGGFDLGVTDASFDMRKDVYKTILERITVLNNAIYNGSYPTQYYVYSDLPSSISAYELEQLEYGLNPWYRDSSSKKFFRSWRFDNISIYFYQCHPETMYSFESNNTITVFGDEITFPGISKVKYDQNGQVVIIELYEVQTQRLVARLRYDNKANVEVIKNIKEKLNDLLTNNEASDCATQQTAYRAVVYFNISGSHPWAIKYCPDGDLTLYSSTGPDDIFATDYFFQRGSSDLFVYINMLLKAQLQ